MSVVTAKTAALGFAAILLLTGKLSFAQSAAPKPAPIDGLMSQLIRAESKLGPNAKHISGAMRNAFSIAHHWESLKAGVSQAANAPSTAPALSVRPLASSTVTTPNLLSRIVGFTQSETSTAWCGANAVVGFNDTGSILETINGSLTGGGLSSVGYAQSTNANTTAPAFIDKGFVPAAQGTAPAGGLLIGDPVVACTTANNFYMSNVGFTCQSIDPSGLCSASDTNIDVSISTNGGATFAPPVIAVDKSFGSNGLGIPNHMLDKDWMAIDPNSGEIYVTYTDIDNSFDPGNECGSISIGPFLFPIQRVAIEIVSSTNGGANWSAPVEITHVCDDVSPNLFVQGSQIAIKSDGSVYVAWETTGNTSSPFSEIDIASSTNQGMKFTPPIMVTPVDCVGDCVDGLQGSIRIGELASLAVGKGTRLDKLFLTWNDGDHSVFDVGIGANYNFADVMLTSFNGTSWSAPVKVNTNPVSNTDHFQPAVASDQNGRVAVCFYDRRNDPNNFYIDRYCANSTNGGASFGTNTRITTKSFLSVVNQDLQLGGNNYMGDYDTLAADTMNSTKGFRGGFGNNLTGAPNIQENKF